MRDGLLYCISKVCTLFDLDKRGPGTSLLNQPCICYVLVCDGIVYNLGKHNRIGVAVWCTFLMAFNTITMVWYSADKIFVGYVFSRYKCWPFFFSCVSGPCCRFCPNFSLYFSPSEYITFSLSESRGARERLASECCTHWHHSNVGRRGEKAQAARPA